MKKRLFIPLMLLTFFGCSKDDLKESIPLETNELETNSYNNHRLKGTYFTPEFWDWENENFINFKGSNIQVPWASGSPAAAIPLEIKNDFLRSDGWELLFNNFHYAQADPVFILYNKFKGVARVFMWVTNSTYTASSFTWGFGIKTLNCQTSAFNFNRIMALPYSSKLLNPTIYHLNYSSDVSVPNGINPNHWYYSEVELMYDPNMANLSHDNIEFCLHSFLTDRKYVKLTGTISGSIKGTFSLPTSGATSGLFSDLVSGFDINKVGKLNFPTKEETTKWFTDYISKQTNSVLKSKLNSALTSLSSFISPSNFLLKTLTSGLISSSSSSPGSINCQLEARTSNEGTITTITAGPNVSFLYPGTQLTTKGGILPNYNKQLGVWHINNKPVIKNTQSSVKIDYQYQITNNLSIDENSFSVIINPEVIQNSSNILIKKQIVIKPSYMDFEIYGAYLIDSRNYSLEYLSSGSYFQYIYLYPRPRPLNEVLKVRITIEITPIGKSDPIILIKDFDANLIH